VKYKQAIIFIFFFLSGIMLLSQPGKKQQDSARISIETSESKIRSEIDSLLKLTELSQQDTLKVNRLNILAVLFSNFSYDSAIGYATDAKNLSERINYPQGFSRALRNLGLITEAFKKNWATTIDFYKQAIVIAEKNNLYIDLHEYYSNVRNAYFYLGDYPNAMEIVTRELAGYEKMKDKPGIAHCNNFLGYIYFKQENFSEAEKYYNRYINNTRELNDSTMLAHALGEIADVYTEEKKYDQSFTSLFTVLKICDQHSDSSGYSAKNEIKAWLPQYKGKAMYRLGKNYKLTGNLPEALKYSLAAMYFRPEIGITEYDKASNYINIGDIYKELKEYSKAINYLNLGLAISQRIDHRENTRDAAGYLSQTYALQQRYDSAFFFYRLFTSLKDSIVNNETKMKIAGIQGQYDVAKKDKEIVRQHQFRDILIGSFVFLLLTLVFLYNRYQLRQKNKYQKELNRQQNELFNAIAAAQDQERKRIAQDIHDSLGSILSAAKLKLSALKESQSSLSDEQTEKFRTTLQLLDEASAELRSISHNIMPATLSKLGLIAALKNLSNTISSHSGLQINFTSHDFTERIPEQTEMSIYRIVLELINNIVKHAQANKVTVQLIKYPDYINLSVEDNGRGFDYGSALQEKKGIGLGNILSRVEFLKGKMNVDSVPGRGTTVIIDIPLENAGT
jgi:two-component system, NarL family, sensor kinase